ncbi:Dps family protein [Marinoscillum furvescens]|uniref:Starvation-inducible DNA-binding protein n=1 Tax=Marinoscillum furvescens DSM 4134 TaxID=1122208 RepID=A0A3D9L454_MARFU|nr:DNA starvation/stationary phase protection protein [Marinoscillum furvescens]RED99727.1 starvation-inducible DNA-binding protein [Marinoscillum furvescens DSM 4134]
MASEKLITELNQLLSDFHIYYQNTRGFHWNIKGKRFFELHAKFEELYTEALTNIDDLAERILTIKGQPLHSFQAYLETSKIQPVTNMSEDDKIVKSLLDQLETLVAQENVVKELAAGEGDSETEDMMIGLINDQEKTMWMFRSWLGQ